MDRNDIDVVVSVRIDVYNVCYIGIGMGIDYIDVGIGRG